MRKNYRYLFDGVFYHGSILEAALPEEAEKLTDSYDVRAYQSFLA